MIVSISRCPSCGGHDYRRSRARPPLPLHLIGFRFVRCRRCYSRFLRHTLQHDSPESDAAAQADPLAAPNRRQAQRFTLRVPATIGLPSSGTDSSPPPEAIEGSTRDISVRGVSVVLPGIENGVRLMASANLPLQISLYFPNKQIDVSARAVRLAEPGGEAGADYVLGAYITEVAGGFSALFSAIVHHASGG